MFDIPKMQGQSFGERVAAGSIGHEIRSLSLAGCNTASILAGPDCRSAGRQSIDLIGVVGAGVASSAR